MGSDCPPTPPDFTPGARRAPERHLKEKQHTTAEKIQQLLQGRRLQATGWTADGQHHPAVTRTMLSIAWPGTTQFNVICVMFENDVLSGKSRSNSLEASATFVRTDSHTERIATPCWSSAKDGSICVFLDVFRAWVTTRRVGYTFDAKNFANMTYFQDRRAGCSEQVRPNPKWVSSEGASTGWAISHFHPRDI